MKNCTPQDISRFWSMIDASAGLDGCWPWKRNNQKGYGRLKWAGKTEQSHRVSYLLEYGDCPDDRNVIRTCDTSSCVNPRHLVLEPLPLERYWSSVLVAGPDDCWEWQAGRHKRGYGTLRWLDHKMEKAHRVAWILKNGEIPSDLEVCHKCDNPPCCNPSHLFLGTHTDNVRDMVAKGRLVAPRGEQHGGAKFSDSKIAEMREAYKQGEGPRSIARRFGVSRTHTYYILKEQSRKSCKPPQIS